jgi:endoglucanase
MIPNTKLRDLVLATAKENDIPVQFDSVPAGGTDAGRFHVAGHGVPSLAFGIPSRYIHTHASIIHRDDFDNAVKLLAAVIRKLDRALVEDIKQG